MTVILMDPELEPLRQVAFWYWGECYTVRIEYKDAISQPTSRWEEAWQEVKKDPIARRQLYDAYNTEIAPYRQKLERALIKLQFERERRVQDAWREIHQKHTGGRRSPLCEHCAP